MLQEVHAGDVVRVDGEPQPWRVESKTRDGLLTLEALHAMNRMRWAGVHEFRVEKSAVFS
ncbi:hypothetical protein MUN78_04550 [Leucobacter allii]|uniref:Uncharacterized protein n=1 Tax=Leucobacter allii TaxID=2932247 RepID=A0ABY4FPE3_9MICO|nr:hypothetical protein [Leucobacter allii]UOQ58122.1 hypothetical protein MUN78_04550 [Leucobacter allii]